jgi:hypothetical protein
MANVTVRATAPAAPSTSLAAGEVHYVNTLNYLRVRLQAQVATVSVRPYYEVDRDAGVWWPLRGDGASTAAPANVTADPTVRGGKAEGLYYSGGLSCAVVLVAETGLVANVVRAEIQAADGEI